jgi:soluble lytic murein transglycosylase-like protein
MIRPIAIAAALLVIPAAPAFSLSTQYDALISRHAAANGLPESLVRRVIMKESRFNHTVVSKGNYGLMQIRLGTARGLGYSGSAAGLLDPDTNMTYAVRYLAGAYKAAGGNPDRAVSYYQSGYHGVGRPQARGVQGFGAFWGDFGRQRTKRTVSARAKRDFLTYRADTTR